MSNVERCTVSFEQDGQTVSHAVSGPSAVLGRSSECDVVIPVVGVSRAHAQLVLESGVWKVVDLDSVNGTFINGVRVSAARLQSGDRIMLGDIGLDVVIGDGSAPRTGGDPRGVSGRATLAFETVAEQREVSVLFCYLDKFSTITEEMPAAAVALLLNGICEQLADIIDEMGGTVCAVAGDGITAFFGTSAMRDDHARRATEAALRMRAAVAAINDRMDTEPPLSMRFGVNSGTVVVGDIGPATHRQYTVVGDTAIVAARLAHTTAMSGEILVGKSTHGAIEEQFVCRALPSQRVRDRAERVEPFVVEGRR